MYEDKILRKQNSKEIEHQITGMLDTLLEEQHSTDYAGDCIVINEPHTLFSFEARRKNKKHFTMNNAIPNNDMININLNKCHNSQPQFGNIGYLNKTDGNGSMYFNSVGNVQRASRKWNTITPSIFPNAHFDNSGEQPFISNFELDERKLRTTFKKMSVIDKPKEDSEDVHLHLLEYVIKMKCEKFDDHLFPMFKGKFLELFRTQNGSRIVQKLLKNTDELKLKIILNEVNSIYSDSVKFK